MHPLQQLANLAPSCNSSCSLSPSEELFDTALMLPNVQEEFLFHVDDIIMQGSDVTAICSNLEEQWMAAMPDCRWTDNYWHDHDFTHVGNDNAEDECSLDLWTNFVEIASQSQTLNNDSSSRSMSPTYLSSETSGTNLVDMNTQFISASPVYSEASSFAPYQHDSHAPFINNHVNEHLDINPCTCNNSTNSMCTSFSPSFFSGETSGTYLANTNYSFIHSSPVYTEASSFVAANQHDDFAIAGTNWRALNLEARASQPQRNLEAGASPLHEAPCYSMNTARAIRNPSHSEARKSGEAVSILVESRTPAIEDGYTWRKYGQKNIKDREHPRGYFRCAQPNCSVKKQTESCSDKQGFVLITYFGRHNH